MISSWELYLWTRLDVFHGFLFEFGTFVLVILCSLSVLAIMTNNFGEWDTSFNDDEKPNYPLDVQNKGIVVKCLKVTGTLLLVFILCQGLIPTKKEAAMIWVIPQLATVENADLLKGEAAEMYTLAKEAMKESIVVKEKE